MSTSKMPKEMNIAHSFTFVYLTFAHLTDGELADSERETILVKVNEWIPDQTMAVTRVIMDETIDWYNSLNNEQRLESMVAQLLVAKEHLTLEQRRAIYNDCVDIANADGTAHAEEGRWLELMKGNLGL
jgi:hypothetical protein